MRFGRGRIIPAAPFAYIVLMFVVQAPLHPSPGNAKSPRELSPAGRSVSSPDTVPASAHRPPRKRPPPYLKTVARQGDITVWLVDGAYVRSHLDEEFTNFGQHYAFECIPQNEFWLDREGQADERQFFITHLLVEHELMAAGIPYDSALERADSVELNERKKAGDLLKLNGDTASLPDARRLHLRLWKRLGSGLSVWIVDGRLVRSNFDIDFTEGGHDCVYEYIPPDEIWIDNDVVGPERPYILLHELHERNCMAGGWTYEKAHDEASRIELYYRHHTSEIHKALIREGWQ